MVCKEFLKKPGAVSRLSSKEQKVFELKFQVLLRLELTSVDFFIVAPLSRIWFNLILVLF